LNKKDRVVVIGAGPCGIAASIQLHRCGIPTCLMEKGQVGGLLRNANLVENYPGFPNGITGELICKLMENQLLASGITPMFEEVMEITPFNAGFNVVTATGLGVNAAAVVIATGTRPLTNRTPCEKNLPAELVYYEVKDLISKHQGKGQHVAIIGAGDAAYDYSLNLISREFKVTMLQRNRPSALSLLRDRVLRNNEITILQHANVISCEEESGIIKIDLDLDGKDSILQADFLLIACGRTPDDRLLCTLDELKIGEDQGLFTGGDLNRGIYRQAGIAVGDGLRAAMAASKYIH